jgi:hypothetical protein
VGSRDSSINHVAVMKNVSGAVHGVPEYTDGFVASTHVFGRTQSIEIVTGVLAWS